MGILGSTAIFCTLDRHHGNWHSFLSTCADTRASPIDPNHFPSTRPIQTDSLLPPLHAYNVIECSFWALDPSRGNATASLELYRHGAYRHWYRFVFVWRGLWLILLLYRLGPSAGSWRWSNRILGDLARIVKGHPIFVSLRSIAGRCNPYLLKDGRWDRLISLWQEQVYKWNSSIEIER